ncbi:MAG: hypothetical protein CMD90_03480 [Gammaproteobacteria bacterium]|nr:hypothetical protein [Gammaproteobacteria bacterium]|tara:strand:+ start:1610 stop:2107 length:498 start_codon:yes stop_codon:yes gene_type:complete
MKYAIWLIPKDNNNFLSSTIDSLAKKHDTIKFTPHVTLHTFNKIQNIKLSDIFKNITGLSVIIKGLGTREEFFKSIFLDIAMNCYLGALNNIAKENFPNDKYIFNPHLSLLYIKTSLQKKREISKEVSGFPEIIEFEKACVVELHSDEEHKGAFPWYETLNEHKF